MKIKIKYFFVFYIFLSLFVYADVIKEIEGKVQIKCKNDWVLAKVGDVVNVGCKVRTLYSGKCVISMYDGSLLKLRSDTVVKRVSRNSYTVDGIVNLYSENVRRAKRIVFNKSYFEFNYGDFTVAGNKNFIWGISHNGEFWAKGKKKKIRVLSNYQTIITKNSEPIEPMPETESKMKVFKKAKIRYDYLEEKAFEKKEKFFKAQAFFMKLKYLKICGKNVDENDEIYLNEDDLIRNKVIIQGEISKTQARDISAVLVSIDGGETYKEANGVSPFIYSFRPRKDEKYVLKIKAVDKDGNESGQTFYNVKIRFINENDRQQLERYMEALVNYLKDEEYSGVMAYFSKENFNGDLNIFSDNLIDFFYYYYFFNIDYTIRSFIKYGDEIEMGIDWNASIVENDTGKNIQKSGFTLFKFSKNSENRWRITDVLDGTVFGISTQPK